MDDNFEKKLIRDLTMTALKEQRARRRWGIFFKMLTVCYVIFLTAVYFYPSGAPLSEGDERYAAVIPIVGVIGGGENSADSINERLRSAFDDDAAHAVILQINSPGGSAVASNRIYKEIRRLREKHPDKKVYAVAGDFCASGGYFIAAAADEIYADEASIIGSIGVIFSSFGFVDAMDKLGVERRVQTAGDNKNLFDPFSQQSDAGVALIDDILENVHEVFVKAVKQGRSNRLSADPAIYSGAVFGGEESRRLGLIDGFMDVGGVARDIVGVEDVIYYREERNFVEKLLGNVLARLGLDGGVRALAE